MRWLKADDVVKGDWIEHKGREWSVASHPEPERVTDPDSVLVFALARVGGEQARMRIAPSEVVKVTREWEAAAASQPLGAVPMR